MKMNYSNQNINYSIKEGKNDFHFSSAHFVIGEGYIEGIHGHNFIVEITAESENLNSHNMVLDFLAVRAIMKPILDKIDHRTIIPKNNPYLEIDSTNDSLEMVIRDKRYKLPKSDTVLLPIKNGTVEELAKYILDQLKPEIISKTKNNPFKGLLKVSISEYSFQSASASTIIE